MKDIRYVEPRTVICNKTHCHCGTDIIIPKREMTTVSERAEQAHASTE